METWQKELQATSGRRRSTPDAGPLARSVPFPPDDDTALLSDLPGGVPSQDTFERVLRRPRFLRRDEDIVYLLRVLRNTWISSKRGRRDVASAPAGEEIEAIEAPHDPIAQAIEGAAVYQALQELTQPLREALVAVDVMGLSYREAASALGTREGTIMSRLHRGRGQVAARLEPAE